MSRTRLIRPEFFSDGLMARLSVGTRLCYIGLWTLCDDAGFFELDIPQIGAELFRFDGPARRERAVTKALAELVAADRVRYLDCGEHGQIPTIPDHRIKGGEALFTVRKRHERRCLQRTPVGLHSPDLRRTPEDYLSVSESVSNGAHARTKEEKRAYLEALRRQGLPVETTA